MNALHEFLLIKRAEAGYKMFITFSGGNAGISLAYVAWQLNIPCHIVVPAFVSDRITNRMKSLGAIVQVSSRHSINKFYPSN